MSEFYEEAVKDLFLSIQRTIMSLFFIGALALFFHQSPNNGELIGTIVFFSCSIVCYLLFKSGRINFAYHFFLVAACIIYVLDFVYFEMRFYGLFILFQNVLIYSFIFLRKYYAWVGCFILIVICQIVSIYYIYKYQDNLNPIMISDMLYCLAHNLGTFILCLFFVKNINKFKDGLDTSRQELESAKEKFNVQESKLKNRTEKLRDYELELQKKSEFETVVSEKLTPLSNNIDNFLGMLAPKVKSNLDEKELEIFNFALQNAEELTKYVNGLHELSFISKRPIVLENFSIARLVQEVKLEFFQQIAEQNAYLGFSGEDEEIYGDKFLMKKFLKLIIENSFHFKTNYRDPEIIISLESDGTGWIIKIKDNGIGIPEEKRASAFNIFTQLEKENTSEGSGIGLAICKQIAQLHNGAIWIENGNLGGISIVLHIPNSK